MRIETKSIDGSHRLRTRTAHCVNFNFAHRTQTPQLNLGVRPLHPTDLEAVQVRSVTEGAELADWTAEISISELLRT